MQSFDVAVIGLGAMGSAGLFQLAQTGASVVGIDRFRPPHIEGSTHGETRITRQATGEGEAYSRLAIRSHQIWREIEEKTGTSLLHEVGGINISRPGEDDENGARSGFLERAMAVADRHAIPHEVIDAAEIRRRFPNFSPADDEIGLYEPGAGYLVPEACVSANLALAHRHGAVLELGRTVTAITQDGSGMKITTDAGTILAGQVVVSAGAWAGRLLGQPFERLFQPKRQVMHWFGLNPAFGKPWQQSPVFVWLHGTSENDIFYGFPSLDGMTMKTADEFYGAASDPDHVERNVTREESAAVYSAHVAGRLAGVSPHAARTITCLYTVTPDHHFLIDRHPEMEKVLVVSPCSGHGFKHSAAIGEAVAHLTTTGTSTADLSAFTLQRFA